MVEIILVSLAVIIAVYFILRSVLNRLAEAEPHNPCQGCSGCSSSEKKDLSDGCSGTDPCGSLKRKT